MAVSLSGPALPLSTELDVSLSHPATWEQIEVCESYLVCCMFEEATSLASLILQNLRKISLNNSTKDAQVEDMMESAGMVLVQSLKELGRTSDIFNDIMLLFGSAAAVPVQVLLTGACFQVAEGCPSGLQPLFEEFLGEWKYVDGKSYVLEAKVEPQVSSSEGCVRCSFLEVERYLEVADFYATTLLGRVMGDMDLAISWVEKAELPEESRQAMLRKLRSLYSLKNSTSSICSGTTQQLERNGLHHLPGIDSATSGVKGFSDAVGTRHQPNGVTAKSASLKSRHPSFWSFSKWISPLFWWFRTFSLRISNARLIISHGRIVLLSSLFLMSYYILHRKGSVLKRIAARQALSVGKALRDVWQLAFSVQVNPLAAVQPLPVATHGGR